MSNPTYFALAAVAAASLIALALVAPQGLGARAPGPFGHPLAPVKPAAPAGPTPLRGPL